MAWESLPWSRWTLRLSGLPLATLTSNSAPSLACVMSRCPLNFSLSQRSVATSGFLAPYICFSRLFLPWVIFVLVCFVFTVRWLCKPAERVNLTCFTVNTIVTKVLWELGNANLCCYPIVKRFRKVFRITLSLHSQRALAVTMQNLMYYLIDIILYTY